MGTIVTLPPPRRRRASNASTTSEATILLFMGVRYVRDIEDAAVEDVGAEAVPDHTPECPPLEIA